MKRFKVIEQYIEGKNNMSCEDRIVVADSFAAIIDGATSKSDFQFEGKTSGAIAAELLSDAIHTLPSDASLAETICVLTGVIHAFYIEHDMLELLTRDPSAKITASVAIYSAHYNQVWFIGDCQAIVNNKYYTVPKILDDILANTRALYIAEKIKLGATEEEFRMNDEGRAFILPLLKNQAIYQNDGSSSEYSYTVVDGISPDLDSIKVVDVFESEIVLASDGYPKLFNTLTESEEHLTYLLKNDPLCYKENKCTKGLMEGNISFDDRSYLKIEVV